MKVLLIDDSRTMRNVQKMTLTEMPGTEFFEAGDGCEALKVLAEHGPCDLILVDWNMPTMNGLEFIKKLRETDRKTPVMMVTTESEKQCVIQAVQAGANNFVIKPFTPETLLDKVRKTMQRAMAA